MAAFTEKPRNRTGSEASLCKGLNGNPNARLEQEGQFFIWGGFYTVECSEHERIIKLCDFSEIIKQSKHFTRPVCLV